MNSHRMKSIVPRVRRLACISLGLALAAAPALAQSLADRVSRASDGSVQFSFAARPGVCGNGRTFISIDSHAFYGSYSGSDVMRREQCQSGPVRVVMTRADRAVVDIDTYVGPASTTQGVTDLGVAPAREAADYLLSLAAKLDGRPGKDAIFPAMLADSADTDAALLAIARDKNRPRETRRSAVSWLGRSADRRLSAPADRVTGALVEIAKDATDNQTVREQALSVLSRMEHGDGIPALMELSRGTQDGWLAKKSLSAIARSGDPRTREFLRTVAKRDDTTEELRVIAIRGIGREYATNEDAQFLRGLYPALTSEDAKESVIAAVAEIGGLENSRWLLTIVRNEQEPSKLRRRALTGAQKAGVPTADLLKLYDASADQQLKQTLIGLYAQAGERDATDKLISIARAEEDRTLRRRAISSLSKSDDPKVKKALQEIVER
ncbi:MAG: HEAT repeat domain-containing protein [Gemmatimonadaceae bacterium]